MIEGHFILVFMGVDKDITISRIREEKWNFQVMKERNNLKKLDFGSLEENSKPGKTACPELIYSIR